MKRKANIVLAISTALLLCGCSNKTTPVSEPITQEVSATTAEVPTTTEVETTIPEIEPVTISLVAVGDMLMHGGVSIRALQADGSYNYDYMFENVRDAISGADLAIVNNEVIMAGNTLGENGNGIIGYPSFNVRTELGDAEVRAGFDVILGATNHTMDQNASGILNTVNFWKTSHPDITLLGIHDSAESASSITIKEVNGIKLALFNYTYGLNGYSLPEGYEYTVKLMNEYTKASIATELQQAKEMADFVIVFPHWGTEYQLKETEEQHEWADFFANNGVDLIIGTHPHVVEPVKWVDGKNGHKMLVYYSLGNYTSIQYYNYSMLGGMAKVSITKNSQGTYISDYGMDFLVTHYNVGRSGMSTYYLDQYTDELAANHAILTEPGENFMSVNQYYPFTVEGLKNLAKQICPDLVN